MIKPQLRSSKDFSEEEEQQLFLTPEEIRAFPKYANASDEEVWNAIISFHKLALICYEAFVKEEHAQEKCQVV